MGKLTYEEAGEISAELINFMGNRAFHNLMDTLDKEETVKDCSLQSMLEDA